MLEIVLAGGVGLVAGGGITWMLMSDKVDAYAARHDLKALALEAAMLNVGRLRTENAELAEKLEARRAAAAKGGKTTAERRRAPVLAKLAEMQAAQGRTMQEAFDGGLLTKNATGAATAPKKRGSDDLQPIAASGGAAVNSRSKRPSRKRPQ